MSGDHPAYMTIDSDDEYQSDTYTDDPVPTHRATPAQFVSSAAASFMRAGMDMHGLHRTGQPTGRFQDTFQCNSMAMCAQLRASDIDRLNCSGLIVLPLSAVQRTAHDVEDGAAALFRITNESSSEQRTYAGMADQTCSEGHAYLPYWMMQTLQLNEGDLADIKLVNLPKGKYVEFEWQDEAFLEITDPRAVLERALKSYFTLTPGDTICIDYNERKYSLRVVRVRPEAAGGVCVLNTNAVVEFRAPPGYQEPVRPTPTSEAGEVKIPELAPPPAVAEEKAGFSRFAGTGQSVGRLGNASTSASTTSMPAASTSSTTTINTAVDPNQPPPVLDVPFGRIFLGYPIVPYEDPTAAAAEAEAPVKVFTGTGQSLRKPRKSAQQPGSSTS